MSRAEREDDAGSAPYEWTPPDEIIKSRFLPPGTMAQVKATRRVTAVTTPWVVNEASGVPLRMTVVELSAHPSKRLEHWRRRLDAVVTAIDRLSGRRPTHRPSCIDVTLFRGGARKRLLRRHTSLDPVTANTAFTTTFPSGRCSVFVYRREEALKTLVHEVLHCYAFGNWANCDEELMDRCALAGRCVGPHLPRLLPTEALVDAVAIRVTAERFAGPGAWEACLAHARETAGVLLRHFGRQWRQTASGFEYFVLKLHLMERMEELLAAHEAGLQHPVKARVRRLFPTRAVACAAADSAVQQAAVAPPKYPVSTRMTPAALPDS